MQIIFSSRQFFTNFSLKSAWKLIFSPPNNGLSLIPGEEYSKSFSRYNEKRRGVIRSEALCLALLLSTGRL